MTDSVTVGSYYHLYLKKIIKNVIQITEVPRKRQRKEEEGYDISNDAFSCILTC